MHAGVDIARNQREKVERLCRYVSRPPVASERLALTALGDAAEGRLPKRVEVLRDYLIETLARAAVAQDHGVHHSSRDAPGGSSRRGPDPSSER